MSTRRRRLAAEFAHSPQVFERRKSLFPTETPDEKDSDLGLISPLDFTSDNEEESCLNISTTDSISDYDILGVVDHRDTTYTPIHKTSYAASETMSPLYLSPQTQTVLKGTALNETPAKFSPSQNHKTPHDSTSKNQNLPKLVRKSLLDEVISVKRKSSPSTSPIQKILKVDPKVRTALFPEENDISVPVNSFYSKNDDNVGKLVRNREKLVRPVPVAQSRQTHKTRKKYGQINNGVTHKIRKPKQKKIAKSAVLKKLNQNNSAINEYIQDLSEMKKTRNVTPKPTIEPPKLIKPAIDENKENSTNIESKKRPIEHDDENLQNRKFFKHSHSRGIVNMTKNIKVSVDHGKMSLVEKERRKTTVKPLLTFDTTDFLDEPEKDTTTTDIDNLISNLESESPNRIILQAHSSVLASENSIQLHQQPTNVANLILSPISQMCDVTSGLALTSPKKARNLTSLLDSIPNVSEVLNDASSADMEGKKLFPIFNGGVRSSAKEVKANAVSRITTAKKFKKITPDQMLLDAGQKRFGITQCTECGFLYHLGDPGDETMHQNYHDAGHVLRFAGWKNERLVAEFSTNARIIKILPTDSKIWIKKAKDLMYIVNRDLGCNEQEFNIGDSQVFLYIKNKTIAGCAVAEPVSAAHVMLSPAADQPDTCSEATYPAKCGISRIWTSRNHRKQGIASALVEAVKKSFVAGETLTNDDVAISAPTEMGKQFAASYFKTANYLVYLPR